MTTALARVSFLLVVTGAVFLAMAWADPIGPLMMLAGAGCAAIVLEAQLDRAPAQPDPVLSHRVVVQRVVADGGPPRGTRDVA